LILNINAACRQIGGVLRTGKDLAMKRYLLAAMFSLMLAGAAQAECFADYKAKQDSPLRLHYGVVAVPDAACSVRAAAGVIAPRLAKRGWTLLNVVSVFGPDGLAERKANAGAYFLSF
jgi:hypothetical protein